MNVVSAALNVVQVVKSALNSVSRFVFKRFFADMRRSGGSLRAQLIFWNVVALSLLVGGLGVASRFFTLQYMLQSVDRDLERGVDMFLRPPRVSVLTLGRWENPPLGPPPFGSGEHPPEPGPRGEEDHPHGPQHHGGGHGPPRAYDENSEFRPHHYNADGQSETSSDKRPSWDPNALALALRGKESHTTVLVNEEPVRIFSSPAFDIQGRKGAVQAAYPLRDVYRAVSGIDTALLLMVPIGLLGVMWLGSSLTSRVLRSVRQMTQAAGRIGRGGKTEDFSRRLPVSGRDEFSELAETFNGLLARLDAAFQEQQRTLHLQQRFTADASHELKTPLTIIKGRAGLALSRASTDDRSRRAFQEIDEATTRMAQLVQDLMLLARSDEGGMGRNAVKLSVSDLLEGAVAQSLQSVQSAPPPSFQSTSSHSTSSQSAPSSSQSFQSHSSPQSSSRSSPSQASESRQEGSAPITLNILPDALCVMGNEAELTRLFRNLLDNAVRYTPPAGSIHVTARVGRTRLPDGEDSVVITVEDTGTGIAPEHLPHLGERFYRVDESRTRPTGGTGLGLSICRGIAAAHGGTLAFDSAPGVGTTVTVTLPACRAE